MPHRELKPVFALFVMRCSTHISMRSLINRVGVRLSSEVSARFDKTIALAGLAGTEAFRR
jgi:hypothetical protein